MTLKKVLDNTPKSVYNICKKDGGGFDPSSIPLGNPGYDARETLMETLWPYYKRVRDTYESDPSLFPIPPVFSGGFFRNLVWGSGWPVDLDLFFNSHGLEKEEAEDNLCLFLHKLDLGFTEQDNSYGIANPETFFRVFNCGFMPNTRCPLQAILKDLGPPKDDPLYVTEDFHYNHSKAALSVAGPMEVHYHGHAVAGWEHKLHVQYREGGFAKCDDKFYAKRQFRRVNYTETSLKAVKQKHE